MRIPVNVCTYPVFIYLFTAQTRHAICLSLPSHTQHSICNHICDLMMHCNIWKWMGSIQSAFGELYAFGELNLSNSNKKGTTFNWSSIFVLIKLCNWGNKKIYQKFKKQWERVTFSYFFLIFDFNFVRYISSYGRRRFPIKDTHLRSFSAMFFLTLCSTRFDLS